MVLLPPQPLGADAQADSPFLEVKLQDLQTVPQTGQTALLLVGLMPAAPLHGLSNLLLSLNSAPIVSK